MHLRVKNYNPALMGKAKENYEKEMTQWRMYEFNK